MKIIHRDEITDGALSELLIGAWQYQKKGKSKFASQKELIKIHNALTSFTPSIFGKMAKNVYVPANPQAFNTLQDKLTQGLKIAIESTHKEIEKKYVEFFDQPGFVLYDGMYAAAFGKFIYFYRSKGIRIVWFSDGYIGVYAFYSMIDERGCSISYEEVDGFQVFSEKPVKLYQYTENTGQPNYGKIGDTYFWIKSLANVNMQYEKTYFLEHLMDPPDVQQLSVFSYRVREDLWNIIFAYAKEYLQSENDKDKLDFTKFCFNFMAISGVEPPNMALISFIEHILLNQNVVSNTRQALAVLQELRQRVSDINNQLIEKPEDALEELHSFKSLIERQSYKDILVNNRPQENIARGFLQTFLAKRSYREVPVRGGQTDLIVFSKQGQFVYETKIWRGKQYYDQGLREIKEYIIGENDKGILKGVFYVIFDPHTSRPATSVLGGEFTTVNINKITVHVIIVNLTVPTPSRAKK